MLATLLITALLAVACGGDGDDQEQIALLQRFIQAGQGPRTNIEMLAGQLVPEFPSDPPLYSPASIVMSFRLSDAERRAFFVLLSTDDARDTVAADIERKLRDGGWRITGASNGRDRTAFQFAKSGSGDWSGSIAITGRPGGQGNEITMSLVQSDGPASTTTFEPGQSFPLPPNFPSSMPIYPGATIIDTSWEQTSDGREFNIRFVTQDSEDQVLLFYERELPNSGWEVADQFQGPDISSLFIADPINQRPAGFILTRQFPEDERFVEVSLQISIIERQQ